ncbi:MAG: hypothetical protein GXO24_07220 [Chlorobi bacterium]|nr:hypothetical protein [Chlorobiota bacterium]
MPVRRFLIWFVPVWMLVFLAFSCQNPRKKTKETEKTEGVYRVPSYAKAFDSIAKTIGSEAYRGFPVHVEEAFCNPQPYRGDFMLEGLQTIKQDDSCTFTVIPERESRALFPFHKFISDVMRSLSPVDVGKDKAYKAKILYGDRAFFLVTYNDSVLWSAMDVCHYYSSGYDMETRVHDARNTLRRGDTLIAGDTVILRYRIGGEPRDTLRATRETYVIDSLGRIRFLGSTGYNHDTH